MSTKQVLARVVITHAYKRTQTHVHAYEHGTSEFSFLVDGLQPVDVEVIQVVHDITRIVVIFNKSCKRAVHCVCVCL